MPDGPASADPYDPELRAHIEAAFARMRRLLIEEAPVLARETDAWMRTLTDGAPPETYFTHLSAFPMLLLPWWLEGGLAVARDAEFDADLVASTIDGYFVVRMIDDLMDGDRPTAAGAIPALIPFQSAFLLAYQRHFGPGDPFWTAFARGALASAEMAAADTGFGAVDRERFVAISARKVTGAKLPIIAVCHRYGRVDLIEPWSSFIDQFGCWHQMNNDMEGWTRDLAPPPGDVLSDRGGRSDASSIPEWVLTEGLAWGATELERWMAACVDAAEALDSPPLLRYLESRQRAAAADSKALEPVLAAVRRLAEAFVEPRTPGR